MVELIATQAGSIQDYANTAHAMWSNSRHPENFQDVKEAIYEEDVTRAQKLGALACLAPMGWALGPGNEMTLGFIAGKTLENTGGNIATGVLAVSATTAGMELLAGLGTSKVTDKFNGAMEILRSRYISKPGESPQEELVATDRPSKKFARVLGIVGLTGTGSTGASLDHSLHDLNPEGRNSRTKKVAVAAAGMLAVINAGYATAILGAAKGAESIGLENATSGIAGAVSNPLLVGGVLASAIALKGQYELHKSKKEFSEEVNSSDENIGTGIGQAELGTSL